MLKRRRLVFFIILIFIAVICNFPYRKDTNISKIFFSAYANLNTPSDENIKPLEMREFVAHAGGGIDTLIYTNSLEALNNNYNKGFRFFEVDLEWTLDNELALIHSWDSNHVTRLFSVEPRVYSLREFKNFKMKNSLTQMSLVDLAKWMLKHRDAYIITDIKSNNLKGLSKIAKDHPGLKGHFIPQIYTFGEYKEVGSLGFQNIILTLYMSNYNDAQILDFLPKHKVLALTMLYDRVNTNFISELKKLGVFIYVHTVNDIALKNKLKTSGIDGFYTDFIEP